MLRMAFNRKEIVASFGSFLLLENLTLPNKENNSPVNYYHFVISITDIFPVTVYFGYRVWEKEMKEFGVTVELHR